MFIVNQIQNGCWLLFIISNLATLFFSNWGSFAFQDTTLLPASSPLHLPPLHLPSSRLQPTPGTVLASTPQPPRSNPLLRTDLHWDPRQTSTSTSAWVPRPVPTTSTYNPPVLPRLGIASASNSLKESAVCRRAQRETIILWRATTTRCWVTWTNPLVSCHTSPR